MARVRIREGGEREKAKKIDTDIWLRKKYMNETIRSCKRRT